MDSYAFIYFEGELPGNICRDDIEDSLEFTFKDCGEITGAGSGIDGCNLDIEFDENKVQPDKVLEIIKEVLQEFKLSISITINIGKTYELNRKN